MTERQQHAYDLFKQGYNCAQSVTLAFADILPVGEKEAAMTASSFGGGMGRLREVCGAVSGMFLVLGMLEGYSEPTDREGKVKQYALVQELAAEFKAENGDIVCKNLLGLPGSHPPVPENRTDGYYKKRPCPELVACATGILEKKLIEKGLLKED